MTATPIVNAGFKYITGMELSWNTVSTITVSNGQARNSDNINDIKLDLPVTINAAANGAGGLDIGALGNNKFYAVYVIGDSFGVGVPSALLSLDLFQPLLPSNYDMYRRVGFVLTNGTAEILKFYQTGLSSDRTMWYDVAIATDVTAGASAVYADVDASDSVPPIATNVIWQVTFTPTGADDQVQLIRKGSAAANGYAIMSGSAAGVVKAGTLFCPISETGQIQYKVTGTATAINVQGYVDTL